MRSIGILFLFPAAAVMSLAHAGSPNYNVPAISGGQKNLVASGAIVLRWH